jgi:predicted Zn finger-like uncharacterized protein
MNIRCHGCGRNFRVRQDRLPAQGARTRCPRCDEVLVIAPPAPGTQEPVKSSPPADHGELFELPPAELVQVQEDLFAVEGQAGGARPGKPGPETGMNAKGDQAPASDAMPAGQADTPPRPGGLRGWLGRLFSRES